MFYWIYDLPLWAGAVLFAVVSSACSKISRMLDFVLILSHFSVFPFFAL